MEAASCSINKYSRRLHFSENRKVKNFSCFHREIGMHGQHIALQNKFIKGNELNVQILFGLQVAISVVINHLHSKSPDALASQCHTYSPQAENAQCFSCQLKTQVRRRIIELPFTILYTLVLVKGLPGYG